MSAGEIEQRGSLPADPAQPDDIYELPPELGLVY